MSRLKRLLEQADQDQSAKYARLIEVEKNSHNAESGTPAWSALIDARNAEYRTSTRRQNLRDKIRNEEESIRESIEESMPEESEEVLDDLTLSAIENLSVDKDNDIENDTKRFRDRMVVAKKELSYHTKLLIVDTTGESVVYFVDSDDFIVDEEYWDFILRGVGAESVDPYDFSPDVTNIVVPSDYDKWAVIYEEKSGLAWATKQGNAGGYMTVGGGESLLKIEDYILQSKKN